MLLKVKNIADIMEKLAPLKLKEDYDNVGLMLGSFDAEVKGILVTLDCTLKVIDEAIEKNCNLIVSHHPLLFRKPASITTDTLLGRKIIKLIRNDINVYSSHTNLDVVKGGINELILNVLGYGEGKVLCEDEPQYSSYSGIGVGRVIDLKNPVKLYELCDRIKKCLDISCLRYAGDDDMLIHRIAVINGSGQDYFNAAKAAEADCIISGDTTYHYISDFEEQGIAVIDAEHYPTEWPAMKLIARYLQDSLSEIGYDNIVYISERGKNPYKTR